MKLYLQVLSKRPVLLLFLGQCGSRLGDGMAYLTISWSVWKSTGSPALTALSMLLQSLPPTIFSLAAGVAADRLSPRRIMLATDAVRMAITLGASALGWMGALDHWGLMATGFLLMTGSVFFNPAKSVLVRSLVDPGLLGAANGLMSGTFLGALLAGQLLGGLLLGPVGLAGLLALNGLTFLLSLVTLAGLPETGAADGTGAARGASFGRRVREGLATLRRSRSLLLVVGTFGIGTFVTGGVMQVAWTMLADRIGGGAPGLGAMATALGLGNVLGSLGCGRLRTENRARVVMLAWAADGLLMALFGWIPAMSLALSYAFLAGVANAYINVPTETLIQLHGGDSVGRVSSFWSITIWAGQSLSLVLLAPLLGRLPMPALLAPLGGGLTLLALAGAWYARDLTAQASHTALAGSPLP